MIKVTTCVYRSWLFLIKHFDANVSEPRTKVILHRGSGGGPIAGIDGGDLRLGGPGWVGKIVLRDMVPNDVIQRSATSGGITAGGSGKSGGIELKNNTDTPIVSLSAWTEEIDRWFAAPGKSVPADAVILRSTIN